MQPENQTSDVLPPPVLPPPIPPVIGIQAPRPESPGRRGLDAGRATLILLAYLGAQAVAGLTAAFAVGLYLGIARGLHLTTVTVAKQIADLQPTTVLLGTVLGVIAGGIVMVVLTQAMAGPCLADRTPTGAAWVYGTPGEWIKGLGIGAAVAIAASLSSAGFEAMGLHPKETALTKLILTPGLPQLAWFALALLVAPPIEELLFRGVLYGAYRRALGPARAAVVVTAIFVLFHLGQIATFPPYALGIGGLAVAALWWRLRTAAVGPAMVVHFGYNLVIVLMAVCRPSS